MNVSSAIDLSWHRTYTKRYRYQEIYRSSVMPSLSLCYYTGVNFMAVTVNYQR